MSSKIEEGELPFEPKAAVELAGVSSKKESLELCTELLKSLEKAKSTADLQSVYEGPYTALSAFLGAKKKELTFSAEIEEALDSDINLNVQFLYNELSYRHMLRYGLPMNNELRQEVWMTYIEVFEQIAMDSELPLPDQWMADLLQGYTDHFLDNSRHVAALDAPAKEALAASITDQDELWNVEDVMKNLQKHVQGDNAFMRVVATICCSRVLFHQGLYQECQHQVQHIQATDLGCLSNCLSLYADLFYLQALCLLFQGRAQHSLSLAQALYRLLVKAKADRPEVLPLLALLSLLTPCEETLLSLLRQQPGYSALSRHEDFPAFFAKAVPAPMAILVAKAQLDESSLRKAEAAQAQVQALFEKAQQVTQFKEVLGLYSSIGLEKASQLLKREPGQVEALIRECQAEGEKVAESGWENSVVGRLPGLKSELRVEFEKGQIKVQENEQQSNYEKIFQKNIQRVKEMKASLESL